jgi:hypothetical protein
MEIIAFEEEAFYKMIAAVVARIKAEHGVKEDKWISGAEAMQKLRITSPTTLQKLRDTGAIRFSQPEKKMILYDSDSINAYLEKHAKNPF